MSNFIHIIIDKIKLRTDIIKLVVFIVLSFSNKIKDSAPKIGIIIKNNNIDKNIINKFRFLYINLNLYTFLNI